MGESTQAQDKELRSIENPPPSRSLAAICGSGPWASATGAFQQRGIRVRRLSWGTARESMALGSGGD